MDNFDIAALVLDKLNWDYEKVLNAGHYSSVPDILAGDFVLAILEAGKMKGLHTKLGVGEQTLNRLVEKVWTPVFGKLNGGGETWAWKLKNYVEIKTCSSCQKNLHFSSFHVDTSHTDNCASYCKECRSLKNALFYESNKETYHKPYAESPRQEYNARNAKRRASKIQATPSWANLSKIKEIYLNCPEGYHVDHFYPLVSDWVCGLHVEVNLQYLTEKDNLAKGNKRLDYH